MTTTEQRITKAAKVMGRAAARLAREDKELADRLAKAVAAEVERFRRGE